MRAYQKGSQALPEGSKGLSEGLEGLPEGLEGLPEGFEDLPEGPEGLLGGLRACYWGLSRGSQGQGDKWMDGISPHSTGLCPLSGPLPCLLLRLHNIK